MDDAAVIALTQKWLTSAVIGLNLCPFAKAVHVKGQIHYAISRDDQHSALLQALENELLALQACAPATRDTTLLMLPQAFPEFLEFQFFLSDCDRQLRRLKLHSVFQIASFHPHYQFAQTEPDDMGNYTNRAPFPILHLLREDSVARAVESFPEPESIYEKNLQTLTNLGLKGWTDLGLMHPGGE
jgi:uncharacterized protein